MELHQFDLNLLVALDALLTERNVTHAGVRVNLSQSAMSGSLARLRRLFHDQLLVSVGRRMVLTPLAQELVDPVREILLLVRGAIATNSHFNAATSNHHFSIAVSDYVTTILMAHMLRDAKPKAPGITFELRPISRRAVEDLEAGRLDFLIGPKGYVSAAHPTEQLFEDTYTCVVWTGNRIAHKTMSIEQFMSLGHVMVRFGEGEAANYDEQFLRKSKFNRRVEVTTPGFDLAPQLVVGTDRIALVTTRLAERYAELLPLRLVPFPVEIPPLIEVLQWHKAHNQNPAHVWFRAQIREAVSRMESASPGASAENSRTLRPRRRPKRSEARSAGRA
jgi:LysR family transcriptional regulator, nod-box dependent transcriptional activator